MGQGAFEFGWTVPSAIVPVETDWLLNPSHPDIGTVTAVVIGPFPFDPRLR